MATPAVASTVCSICGELVDGKDGCLACLLRVGLDDSDDREPIFPAPLVFGDFEIERREDGSYWELGRGAMGVTYRALDKVLHRRVALKVIEVPAEAGDARTARERFLREARAAATLRHANVASVFQFGASSEGDRCYYAMELVDGETLEALVRRDGPLPVKTALEIAIQITRALIAAAAHGLIHRDLKPANIMLTPNESRPAELEAKVIDFGLAKATAKAVGETDLTCGAFVGTPTYASPEQLAGQKADARSDIYSLGVTLWYALTGEVPRSGKTLEEIRSSQSGAALPIKQLTARKVPAPVIRLLRHSLADDPAERPQSARALLGALELCRAAMGAAPRRRAAFFLGLLVLALVGLTSYLRYRQPKAAAVPLEKSIAVLPFENLSTDEANAFLAAGIQDDILTSLAQIHDLRVIGRASVMAYKPGVRNLREIGQALGVANLVEGSVRRVGERVVVNAQLIDARTDRQLWANHYDNSLADSIGLQGQLASEIATALQAKLAPDEQIRLTKKMTGNPDAYALYLKGREREEVVNLSSTELAAAEQLYTQAVAVDPNFALAYARLSIVTSWLAALPSEPRTLVAKGRAAALEALRLSPSLGEAHLALGLSICWFERNFTPALKELYLAATALPNDPLVSYNISAIYRAQGRWREAIGITERVLDRDPRNREAISNAGANYFVVRDWVSTAACYERFLKIAPDSADARISLAYVEVYRREDPARGRKLLQEIPREINPNGMTAHARWDMAMLERDYAGAKKILAESSFEDFPNVGEGALEFFRGRTVLAQGDIKSAQRYFAAAATGFEGSVRNAPGAASAHGRLGLLYAYMQRHDDAIREGRRAVELLPETFVALNGAMEAANLALIYALLNEPNEAIPLIEHLLSTAGPVNCDWSDDFPGSMTLADLRLRWEWDSLRKDPRFQKILAGPEPKTALTSIPQTPAP